MSHTTGSIDWLSVNILVIFGVMFLFYLVRLFSPKEVTSCCGYFTPWQEITHSLCALGMIAMGAPQLFTFIPSITWVLLFSVLTGLYLLKLITREKNEKPGRQWCALHIGIYSGMAYMFAGVHFTLVTYVFVGIYLYVIFFSSKELNISVRIRPFRPLSIGVDAFHITMSAYMVAMFLWPELFMPSMPEMDGPMCLDGVLTKNPLTQ